MEQDTQEEECPWASRTNKDFDLIDLMWAFCIIGYLDSNQSYMAPLPLASGVTYERHATDASFHLSSPVSARLTVSCHLQTGLGWSSVHSLKRRKTGRVQ